MKRIFIGLLVFFSPLVFSTTAISDNFTIDVQMLCAEGNVTCDNVQFILTAAGFDSGKTYIGRTIHTLCADRVTPCAFQGYRFVAEGVTYELLQSGTLQVLEADGTPLLTELYEWKE